MPLTIDWVEITKRLALTLLAGAVLGFNRGERGRPAGLRTTILVSLAASVSMLQVNLLLMTTGKSPDSFVVMDLMRLPLGILTGMGFIGAGAIIKRPHLVEGVTTAATLWLATVIGLCLGGGQMGIGIVALVLGAIVLWCLRWVESGFHHERVGVLTVTVANGEADRNLQRLLVEMGFRLISWASRNGGTPNQRELRCELRWDATAKDVELPTFVGKLAEQEDILDIEWSEIRN